MNAAFETQILAGGVAISVARGRPVTAVTEIEKAQTTFEDQAERLLLSWGRWTRGELNSLSLPKRWVTDKAREGGIDAGSPLPPIVIPEEEAKTDKAVAQLALRHRSILRLAIELAYEMGLGINEVAKHLHCSKAKAKSTVRRAGRAMLRIREVL